jgi:cytochrome oxidase Cu insertion factor (SCO1/SenC/PrrC family)
MRKWLPVLLWLAVLVSFAILSYVRYRQVVAILGDGNEVAQPSEDPPGRFLDDIPWKHFVDIPVFEMTDQEGKVFDSGVLAGSPYLLNFFFTQCPSSCRDLNAAMADINQQLRKEDLRLVSVTIDPANDTPEVLARYARDYDAESGRWYFLTDQKYKITQLGEHVFQVPIGSNPQAHTHVEDILLVDKWGRFRDRFRWDDPFDMRRLLGVVKDVCAETRPPLEKKFRTRNAMAGQIPLDFNRVPWLRELHLSDPQGEPFFSRDLTGELWLVKFISLSSIRADEADWRQFLDLAMGFPAEQLRIVVITVDPERDTPAELKEFFQAQNLPAHWLLLTGESLIVERLASEFFQVQAQPGMIARKVFLVDRWHRLRGGFLLQEAADQEKLQEWIETLATQDRPF